MAIKYNSSFSTGELDPILHDRTTLEKFKKGLATARNVMIGKTGSILSRFPRAHFIKSKNDNQRIKLYSPDNSGRLLEWGEGYVRIYDFQANLLVDLPHALLDEDLDNMHFATSGSFVYVFVKGKQMLKLLFDPIPPETYGFANPLTIFSRPAWLGILQGNFTLPDQGTGYDVVYLATAVYNGEELFNSFLLPGYGLPQNAGESNFIEVLIDNDVTKIDGYNEVRIYRRPLSGSAFGLIGISTTITNSAGTLRATYEDFGSAADFQNGPPVDATKFGFEGADLIDLNPGTGSIYQQRLLIANVETNKEAILASRPGYQNNFTRDVPLSSDSSLVFKSGTTGNAEVLRIVENDGLIVFTSVGVFVSVGALTINNLSLEKKGQWIIDDKLPPLSVPGGVFFVDKNTNTVKQLIFSQDILTYRTADHTVFSGHLFRKRKIQSWAFQDGITPLIIVTFTDGTSASFTYDFEHEMRAWCRHDSRYALEQVEGTGVSDSTFFVTNKDGNRYIEVSLPRYTPALVAFQNPESDKISSNAFMDALKTQSTLLNDDFTAVDDKFTLTPVVAGDFEGEMTLSHASGLFTDPGRGEVGTVFRYFDPVDRSSIDLEIVSRTDDNTVVVQPTAEVSQSHVLGLRLYETFNIVTGLDHLEGEQVSVLVDGYVAASPLNTRGGGAVIVTVAGGQIELPEMDTAAIAIVGRPIVADIKTLNIETVEQSPTLIESINVNKIYIRVYETRGLYISNVFPEEAKCEVDGDSVEEMEDLDKFDVKSTNSIIGNRYKEPVSKRIEQTLPGKWKSGGQVSMRQVDPVHFEILSIIPDVEVLRRSDR